MPQSSLLGWLNKPTVSQGSISSAGLAIKERKDEATSGLPTPPSSSQGNDQDSTILANASVANSPKSVWVNPKRPLPPNVELRACQKEDIPRLKHLTSLLLPISYPEKFYREILDDQLTNNITLLAVWHDEPQAVGKEKGRLVGAIRCRVLNQMPSWKPSPRPQNDGPMLYLSTLVLLSPYRSHGIATHMLDIITRRAIYDYRVTSVGAHVWEANTDGQEWYQKRGFTELSREEGYYRRLKPQGAVVMERRVSVMDLVGG